MSGPQRNPDRLNTIGVVVVGICGAVLVYVSIVALQAFYMGDTSEVQNMADYGGQETQHQSLRATQVNVIEDCAPNAKPEAGKDQTYRIPISYAMKLVAQGAKADPSNLVPVVGRSDKPTILPIFGRPKAPADGKSAGAKAPDTTTNDAKGDVPVAGAEGAQLTPTAGQGPGGAGPPPGQGPTPSAAAGTPGAGAASVDPTGAQSPSPGGKQSGGGGNDPKRPGSTPTETKDMNKAAGSAAGGNAPTPTPRAGVSDPKGGAAAPRAAGSASPTVGAPAGGANTGAGTNTGSGTSTGAPGTNTGSAAPKGSAK